MPKQTYNSIFRKNKKNAPFRVDYETIGEEMDDYERELWVIEVFVHKKCNTKTQTYRVRPIELDDFLKCVSLDVSDAAEYNYI